MAVTADDARALALAFETASEAPHVDRIAFRTPERIFATLAGDGTTINFMFDALLQDFYCEQAPDAFAPVEGGWGRMGATRCQLAIVDPQTFRGALAAAYEKACLPPPRKARSPKTSTKGKP